MAMDERMIVGQSRLLLRLIPLIFRCLALQEEGKLTVQEALIDDPLHDIKKLLNETERSLTATPVSEQERMLVQDPTYVERPNPLRGYYKKKRSAHENGCTPTIARVTRSRVLAIPGIHFYTVLP